MGFSVWRRVGDIAAVFPKILGEVVARFLNLLGVPPDIGGIAGEHGARNLSPFRIHGGPHHDWL